MAKHQDRFDQRRHAGRCFGMPNVRFDRTDKARPRVATVVTKDFGKGVQFDRIAKRGRRSVGFDVGDVIGVCVGRPARPGESPLLGRFRAGQ